MDDNLVTRGDANHARGHEHHSQGRCLSYLGKQTWIMLSLIAIDLEIKSGLHYWIGYYLDTNHYGSKLLNETDPFSLICK